MGNLAKAIELVAPGKLKPYEKNARVHSADQIEKLATSIREYGFANPILVDKDYGVIAGHGRLEAAKKLRLDQVPIIILDYLSDKQKRALILADNRIAEDARWDFGVLKDELGDLEDLELDLSDMGFTDAELDSLLSEIDEPPATAKPQIPAGVTVSAEQLEPPESVDVPTAPSAATEWRGMPEFKQEDKTPYRTIHVHFKSETEVRNFALLVKQSITEKTRYLWYPYIEIETLADKAYVGKS